jgi:putative ABC transport system ATP-binding protein/macrolide transport system ATP-binding/permease protein/lipoprotein-releasing system ATP-binding protein
VGLGERWDSYPGELSGGQLRRVAVARALVNDPQVLFADEPTNDLDADAEREVLSLFEDLRSSHGLTLVLVTHAPEVAAQAERALYMRSGRLASAPEGTVQAALALRAGASSRDGTPPFEPAPASLKPAAVTAPGAGLRRLVLDFTLACLVVAFALYSVNGISARHQRQTLDAKIAMRRAAEDLALQQLRADVEDLKVLPDDTYEASVYLQNFSPQKRLFVLGPTLRVFVQVERVWQQVATSGTTETGVRQVSSDKQLVPIRFRLAPEHFDELLKGYMHVRIHNTMVVSDRADPPEDVFERTDDYYIYLRPAAFSEEAVRKRNGWAEGSIVPLWIPMPAH